MVLINANCEDCFSALLSTLGIHCSMVHQQLTCGAGLLLLQGRRLRHRLHGRLHALLAAAGGGRAGRVLEPLFPRLRSLGTLLPAAWGQDHKSGRRLACKSETLNPKP